MGTDGILRPLVREKNGGECLPPTCRTHNLNTHIQFFFTRCPACKAFQPAYTAVAAHIAARGDTKPKIAVARIDCPDNTELCGDFEVTSYPSLLLGTPEQFSDRSSANLHKVSAGRRTREDVIAAVAKILEISLDLPPEKVQDTLKKDDNNNSKESEENDVRVVKPATPPADLNDLQGAVIQSWQYLTVPAMLRGSKTRQALQDWLDLLIEAHPVAGCREGAEAAATALPLAWPPSAEKATNPKALKSIKICGASSFKDWAGCKGSLPSSRGYTCALWSLLHALSVGLPASDPSCGHRWLLVVRGFVQYFFQCSDCSKNFVKYASTEESLQVTTKKDAVLWMWKTHNYVNERLKKEEDQASSGDPKFPKVQFPTAEQCAACHSSTSSGSEGGWDEGAVYDFLVQHYRGSAAGNGVDSGGSGGGSTGGGTGGGVSPVLFGNSWGAAWMVLVVAAVVVYGMLRHSGQYAFRKAITRKM